jgi:hypothetical protein
MMISVMEMELKKDLQEITSLIVFQTSPEFVPAFGYPESF